MKRVLSSLFFAVATFTFLVSNVCADENLVVTKGKKVKMDYTLKIEGAVIESSVGKQPLEYEHGAGKIIPGLESQLEGLHVGDSKTVVVQPKDGYGEVNPQGFKDIPKTAFPKEMKPEKGMVIEMQGPNKETMPATIWEVKDDKVVLNFNHPLAGKVLEFDIKIISIE